MTSVMTDEEREQQRATLKAETGVDQVTFEDEMANDIVEAIHPTNGAADDDEVVEAKPAWVTEGTADDDESVETDSDLSTAKGREPQADVIPAAKGVLFRITNATLDTFVPRENNPTKAWFSKSLKLWLQVHEGISYKVDGKPGPPKYKNKMFFPKMVIAVNRQAEKDGTFDYAHTQAGKPTTRFKPGGDAFGDYADLLRALGYDTKKAPANDKAFRASLLGKLVIADIELQKNYKTKEPENALFKYRAATGSAKGASSTGPVGEVAE